MCLPDNWSLHHFSCVFILCLYISNICVYACWHMQHCVWSKIFSDCVQKSLPHSRLYSDATIIFSSAKWAKMHCWFFSSMRCTCHENYFLSSIVAFWRQYVVIYLHTQQLHTQLKWQTVTLMHYTGNFGHSLYKQIHHTWVFLQWFLLHHHAWFLTLRPGSIPYRLPSADPSELPVSLQPLQTQGFHSRGNWDICLEHPARPLRHTESQSGLIRQGYYCA